MEARAKVLGHSVHQMMVALPLGLLTGAVMFDVLYLLARREEWYIVSFWLIAAGVVSGLLAAVFGLVDWTKIPPRTRAKRIGAFHGIGNVIVVGLFAASWLLRSGTALTPSSLALSLSFAGGALSLVAGWLGGELVARLGVGVDDGANVNAPSSLSGLPADGGFADAAAAD